MSLFTCSPILLKGTGDIGTGVARRLHRVEFPVIIAEFARPRVVRRTEPFDDAHQSLTAVSGWRSRLLGENNA